MARDVDPGSVHLNAARSAADDARVTMPPVPPLPPSVPPPTGPPPGEKAARRPSVEHVTLSAVLAVVLLAAAGWFLLKPASSSATAVRPQVSPTATAVSSTTAATVPATAPTMTATAKTLRTAVSAPRTGKALTKAAYLKAGNAVCVALHKNIAKLGPAPEGKPVAAYLTQVLRLREDAQVRLDALRAPAGDGARLRQIRTRFAHLMALGRRLATALAHDNEQQIISLSPSVNTAGTQLAAAYRAEGLTACS